MPTFTVFSLPAVVARRRVLNSIFFCLHNGGFICHLSYCILASKAHAHAAGWGGFFGNNKPGFVLVCFSFFSLLFSLHPFPPIFPLKEVTDALEGLLRGLRSCFAWIIPFSPFPIPGCSKNCRDFFTNGVLNLVLGYRIFCLLHCPFFFFFFLHSLANIFLYYLFCILGLCVYPM